MKTLEQKIMSRVRRIYYLRKLASPTAVKAYGILALTLALASAVSLVNVLTNMPSFSTPVSLLRFVVSAVLNTELVVQGILVGLLVLVGFMLRDILHNTKESGRGSFAHV